MFFGLSFKQNQIQGIRMNLIKQRFDSLYRPISKPYDK